MSPARQADATLWTSAEAAEATGGRGAAAWACSGISADSRRVAAGDLFVAIEGPNVDGKLRPFRRGAASTARFVPAVRSSTHGSPPSQPVSL